jgi:hypothetical protein
MKATEIVQNFRLHYTNTASFASSISRFKSELRKTGTVSDWKFLSQLKPTPEEMQKVNEKNRKHLIDKCKRSVTLKSCGDNLIMYFRSCLESSELGPLIMGIQACSGFRMVEAVCRGNIESPRLDHSQHRWCILGMGYRCGQEARCIPWTRAAPLTQKRDYPECFKEATNEPLSATAGKLHRIR